MNKKRAWIGVDFDGTLAYSGTTVFDGPLGEPIPRMLQRVSNWLDEGIIVKIFTARVSPLDQNGKKIPIKKIETVRKRIQLWCLIHLRADLEVVCCKDHNIIMLYDDKAVGIVRDTGEYKGT